MLVRGWVEKLRPFSEGGGRSCGNSAVYRRFLPVNLREVARLSPFRIELVASQGTYNVLF